MSAIFNQAIEDGILIGNPALRPGRFIKAVLDTSKANHPRYYPLFAAAPYAGLRQIRSHDIRHSYAGWLVGNGESLSCVREQLRHHSIQITVDTYGNLIPGAYRQAVNRLAAMVEKSATQAQPAAAAQVLQSPNILN